MSAAVALVLICFLTSELSVFSTLNESRNGFKEVSTIVEMFGGG